MLLITVMKKYIVLKKDGEEPLLFYMRYRPVKYGEKDRRRVFRLSSYMEHINIMSRNGAGQQDCQSVVRSILSEEDLLSVDSAAV